jgi:hypothetical protein
VLQTFSIFAYQSKVNEQRAEEGLLRVWEKKRRAVKRWGGREEREEG